MAAATTEAKERGEHHGGRRERSQEASASPTRRSHGPDHRDPFALLITPPGRGDRMRFGKKPYHLSRGRCPRAGTPAGSHDGARRYHRRDVRTHPRRRRARRVPRAARPRRGRARAPRDRTQPHPRRVRRARDPRHDAIPPTAQTIELANILRDDVVTPRSRRRGSWRTRRPPRASSSSSRRSSAARELRGSRRPDGALGAGDGRRTP